jgi:hypothetical protein
VPPPEPHTKLTFGDGVHGSRLPTGVENVTGEYRVGAGRSGNVAAGSITQLTTRPSGVSEATNPIATGGGTDADGPDDTRVVMPLRMLALDRLVSVRDYEDFTRARAGIGKASARKLYDGRRHCVHVTVAAAGDVYVDESSALVTTLEQALSELGDVALPLHVAVRERVLLVISAGVKVLPDYSWDLVEPALRAAVADTFGFDRRKLGQPAYLSEVVSALQHVEGVDYVDVDVFAGIPGQAGPEELATIVETLEGAAPCVPARLAYFEERAERVRSDSLPEFAGRFGLTLQQLLALNPSLADIEFSYGERLVVWRGIHPAQLTVFDPSIPETLVLRRIV